MKDKYQLLKHFVIFVFLALYFSSPAIARGINIGTNGSMYTKPGSGINFKRNSLNVSNGGAFYGSSKNGKKAPGTAGSYITGVSSVTIGANSRLELGQDNVTIESGRFINNGTYAAGTSTVNLNLINDAQGELTGNNVFHNLVINANTLQTSNKAPGNNRINLRSNQTQTITGSFAVKSSKSNNPVVMRSTTAGQRAFLSFAGNKNGRVAAVNIGIVDINDIAVVEQTVCVAPGSIIGPNASGFQVCNEIFRDGFEN